MMILPVDEVNQLSFESYYGEMAISKEQKEWRIRIAESFLDDLLFLFAYAKRKPGKGELEAKLKTALISLIPSEFKRDGVVTDQYMKEHIALFVTSVIATTMRYIDSEYYTSYDRAWHLAADEGNILGNYSVYTDAVKAGKTKKTWLTMKDERVRDTHIAVDGTTIPIKDYFLVGTSWMRFPLDQSLGASPSETINCRCVLEYT